MKKLVALENRVILCTKYLLFVWEVVASKLGLLGLKVIELCVCVTVGLVKETTHFSAQSIQLFKLIFENQKFFSDLIEKKTHYLDSQVSALIGKPNGCPTGHGETKVCYPNYISTCPRLSDKMFL